jgi:hypothetical protein
VTLPVMIYSVVLALLVAGAAHFLDRALRSLGRPTRWAWFGALAAVGVTPFLPRLVPAGEPEALGGGLGLPVEFLYEMGTVVPLRTRDHGCSFRPSRDLWQSFGSSAPPSFSWCLPLVGCDCTGSAAFGRRRKSAAKTCCWSEGSHTSCN